MWTLVGTTGSRLEHLGQNVGSVAMSEILRGVGDGDVARIPSLTARQGLEKLCDSASKIPVQGFVARERSRASARRAGRREWPPDLPRHVATPVDTGRYGDSSEDFRWNVGVARSAPRRPVLTERRRRPARYVRRVALARLFFKGAAAATDDP
jgi:hypothetical protein